MDFQPWDNPMGTDGFEFIEYAVPDPKALGALFEQIGFSAIARHRHKDVTLYRQGGINIIITRNTSTSITAKASSTSRWAPTTSTAPSTT